MLFERIKAENTATAALVQNLRDAISTKDSLIESLKKDIGANEEQTKKVFFFTLVHFYFFPWSLLGSVPSKYTKNHCDNIWLELISLLGANPSVRRAIKFDPLWCLKETVSHDAFLIHLLLRFEPQTFTNNCIKYATSPHVSFKY